MEIPSRTYESPELTSLELLPEALICESPQAGENEMIQYEDWDL